MQVLLGDLRRCVRITILVYNCTENIVISEEVFISLVESNAVTSMGKVYKKPNGCDVDTTSPTV